MTTKNKGTASAEVVVSPPGGLAVTGDLEVIAGRLVDQARAEGISLTGEGGLLPALVARVLETGLAAELTEHLGYERHAVEGGLPREEGTSELACPRGRPGRMPSCPSPIRRSSATMS